MKNWSIEYDNYNPEEESLREALCTLGNGYFAVRGAGEETSDDGIHYPGTYLAGGYNRMKSLVAGETIENEDFVNWPNWLPFNFMPEGGEWFALDKVEIINYRQVLNLREGLLERVILFRDNEYRETEIISKRIIHIDDAHKGAIQWLITPKNWSGRIIIRNAIDGTVINNGVKRYSSLNQQHLEPFATGHVGKTGIYHTTSTRQSRIRMAIASKMNVYTNGKEIKPQRRFHEKEGFVAQVLQFMVEKNQQYRIEKIAAIYTSKDMAISEPLHEAQKAINRSLDFDGLYRTHRLGWERIWHRCDIEIDGDDENQLALRLHIFHLLQTLSKNIMDLDVGAPARGLHGEAYRGHIFWDELFIFPIINFIYPEITRELLMYRFRRLPEARYGAKKEGYTGAMFPWQSGSDGREESQIIHLNPASGRWLPDYTYLQRHVNAAIAYNIWQYYQISNDREFLSFYGAEMFLDIAKFWGSKTEFNKERGRYEVKHVVGPDEYHTHYPESDEPGINNNAYTNIMVVWTLLTAQKILDILKNGRKGELMKELEISDTDLERWDDITRRMFIPMLPDGVIEQFEGFDGLKELEWEKYINKYGAILRLDRVLESEDDDVNRYKACKQADALMLFYLFPGEELGRIFNRLGYDFNEGSIVNNINYYDKRSSHGSTLSKLVHSWVTARSSREKSWNNFKDALMSDLRDIQGGTTSEGIHLGAMAGTVDIVQRCYTGMEIKDNILSFNPDMPEKINRIATRLQYRGFCLDLSLTHQALKLKCSGGWYDSIKIFFRDKLYDLHRDDEMVFDL
jgi:alpha,alpha-trehalase